MFTFLLKILLADYAQTGDAVLAAPAALVELPSQAVSKSPLRLAA